MMNTSILSTLPVGVILIAVTKTLPVAVIEEAYRSGIRHFGENYVEEFEEKYDALPQEIKDNAIFHMIGHVQSRKVKRVVELFDWVDSVDSIKLANKLNEEAQRQGRSVSILLEVNLTGEASKYGFDPAGFFQNVAAIHALPALLISGLMTMPPAVGNPDDNRMIFRSLKKLSETIRKKHPAFGPALSMGTSQDYAVAIEEGATMVRLGKALFGPRQLQK